MVAEAGRLADEAGLDQLTLTALATRLGVRQPSLYKHVDGLTALRVGLATAALADLQVALSAATVGRSGLAAVIGLADAYRAFARRHPGTYPTTLAAPDPQDAEHVAAAAGVLDVVLAALAGFDLHDHDAVDAVRGLRALMHGFVTLEAAGGFRIPQDPERSYRRLVEAYARTLADWSSEA